MADKNKEIRIRFRDQNIGGITVKGNWWFVNDGWLLVEQDVGAETTLTVFSAPQESILCVYALNSEI